MISVFGAGSYGTALAIQLARNGHQVLLWGRDDTAMKQLQDDRCNLRYLPNCPFPDRMRVCADFNEAVKADQWLLAVPSHAFKTMLDLLKPHWRPGVQLISAVKGFSPDGARMPHEIVSAEWPDAPFVAISGPTFAREVGLGMPSALTIASNDQKLATSVAELFHGTGMRAYTSDDVVGVAVGGGVKNVIAIAVGAADGLGLGANTRVLLITRGLSEMSRLAEALGGKSETMMGLAGIGDLVLTCTDDQSRNRRFGKAIGRGDDLEAAEAAIGQVVEGYRNAVEVHALAERHGVDMPISTEVFKVLHENVPVREAFWRLTSRPQRAE